MTVGRKGRVAAGAAVIVGMMIALAACGGGAGTAAAPGTSASASVPATFEPPTSPVTSEPGGAASPSSAALPPGFTAASPTAGAPSVSAPNDSRRGTQLPRGGTRLFPRYRLVGYSGGESSPAFGRLGVGNLDRRVDEIERTARAYTQGGRRPLPVLELITVVAQSQPGRDGKYRTRISDTQITRYLAAARRHRALLLLNIQPGRADFLTEVKALNRWLAEPDIGIALDPEWAVGKGQVPGRTFGRTTATQINSVAAYLSSIVRSRGLPEKALVVHQLAPRIISRVQNVSRHPGVQVILSVDGIGSRAAKTSTWRRLVKPLPAAVHPGFKLFFEEDRRHGKLMTPRQVIQLHPTPDYVLYE